MRKSAVTRAAYIVFLPVLFALLMRGMFGIRSWQEMFSVMTIAFIFVLPIGVGALTIFLSPARKVRSFAYRFFMPWLPILVFFVLTLALNIEGWACWLMILPVYLAGSTVGGFLAGYFKLRKRNERLSVSFILFLPFLVSPLEQMVGNIPGSYKAYTYIDIRADRHRIWNNVTNVREISPNEDRGWLTRSLGFPRPIKAELNYKGVGAFRKAIFEKGLVFYETVLTYEPEKKMVFSIKANAYDIPSATMDDHIVVGGRYFDVLKGTYELEQLTDSTCRLHLYSAFKMSTNFNFYSGIWARWIMKDIQQNILQVIKIRAENEAAY